LNKELHQLTFTFIGNQQSSTPFDKYAESDDDDDDDDDFDHG